ncbi:MAG: Uncharacterized protein CEN90_66 [Parcubacteria group bacterium Licking1014_17]|nr:MAG: Uncharacterized protein CEN90_66 [Parcubacteria group bacterium Licking1014_17]
MVCDIETVGEDFDSLDKTTQDVLTDWIRKESGTEEEYRVALEELKNRLGFSPLTAQAVAVGLLDVDGDKGAVYYQNPADKNQESEEGGIKYKAMSEPEMLSKFWELAGKCREVITFNGRSFDVPFLIIRSAVHKIRPSVNLMPPRFASDSRHIDLLDQLTYYGSVRKKGNLHLWSRVFGITSPKEQGVKGEDVGRLFKEGKYLEIAKYNAGDLFATRELYEIWDDYVRF